VNQKSIDIGLSITDGNFDFFGTDEINASLSQGWLITRILPGGVILSPTGEMMEGGEQFALTGWKITLVMRKLDELCQATA
jgi:hypothetical protein